MITPPIEIMMVIGCFAQVFSERTWDWVLVLVVGAILAPGKRTVTSVLTAVGLSQEKQYQRYHRVLNRATWSGLQASQILLGLLVGAFVATGGTIVLAADETLERRKGKRQPSLEQRLEDPNTRWRTISIPWYGGISLCSAVDARDRESAQ